MRSLLLLVLLALPGVVRADPPFLIAARDRQRGGRGFEATLAVHLEFPNVKPFARPPGVDHVVATGRAKLLVEGEKFRYDVDMPVFDPKRNEVTRRREELSFDGRRVFVRPLDPAAEGHIFENRPPDGWGDPFLPLEWTYRGTNTLLAPVPRPGEAAGGEDVSFELTGREERIGGRRSVEVVRRTGAAGGNDHESVWFDLERAYLPRRVRGVTIESVSHPRFGWRPSGWTSRTEVSDRDADGKLVTGEVVTTVTVDSFEWRRMVPTDQFTLPFSVGQQVTRHSDAGEETLVVAEDGTLVPLDPKAEPQPELPSLHRSLWVVGVAVAGFAAFVVFVKRLARRSPEHRTGS